MRNSKIWKKERDTIENKNVTATIIYGTVYEIVNHGKVESIGYVVDPYDESAIEEYCHNHSYNEGGLMVRLSDNCKEFLINGEPVMYRINKCYRTITRSKAEDNLVFASNTDRLSLNSSYYYKFVNMNEDELLAYKPSSREKNTYDFVKETMYSNYNFMFKVEDK